MLILLRTNFVSSASSQNARLFVDLKDPAFKTIVALRDALAVESVGLNDICTSTQVLLMDLSHQVRLRYVVILDEFFNMLEFFSSVVFFFKAVSLNLSAHATIKDNDSFIKNLVQVCFDLGDIEVVLRDVFALQAALFNHSDLVCFGMFSLVLVI